MEYLKRKEVTCTQHNGNAGVSRQDTRFSKDSLQFDIQIYFGYKYAVRCHRHANNTELHSP